MSSQSARPLNPAPEEFAGDSFGRSLKRAFHATRPKFYPASVLPVVVGTSWGVSASGSFDLYIFVLALVATVCVHAASNVLNDVGDEAIGTDPRNEQRIYPYTGGSRFIQTGILSPRSMARIGITLIAIASIIGILLLIERGPMVIAFGIAGILLAVLYSLGPVKLSSIGLGEATIVVAFGMLPVTGAAWLQGAPIDASLLLFSIPIGLWVENILLINEVPDMEADGASGKRTFPVRFGLNATANLYFAANVAAAAIVLLLTVSGKLPLLAPVVPIGLLALAFKASRGIRGGIADRPLMTQSIETTLAIQTIGSIWLAGCALYALWF